VLEQNLLHSPYSLTEARVLFELAQQDGMTAKEIGAKLGLDAGYLSRIVHAFTEKNLITRKASPTDKRQYSLALTAKGRLAFGQLNRTSHNDVAGMLAALPPSGKERLVEAMSAIEHLLDDEAPHQRSRCARIGPATWAGLCSNTRALCANMAGTFHSRDSARRSPRNF
jgi:DNA-binding MarR family transcriptional regulator